MSGQPSKSSARAGGKRKELRERLGRDRRGCEPYTNAQVLARWYRIRDGALNQLEELIVVGEHKGQLSVKDTIVTAQAEINGLERLLGISTGTDANRFAWADEAPPEPEAEA